MEVSVEVHKIIKFIIYDTIILLFLIQVNGGVLINLTNYQRSQFNVHFIHCQKSTDVLGTGNQFVQYAQKYFQYVFIPI